MAEKEKKPKPTKKSVKKTAKKPAAPKRASGAKKPSGSGTRGKSASPAAKSKVGKTTAKTANKKTVAKKTPPVSAKTGVKQRAASAKIKPAAPKAVSPVKRSKLKKAEPLKEKAGLAKKTAAPKLSSSSKETTKTSRVKTASKAGRKPAAATKARKPAAVKPKTVARATVTAKTAPAKKMPAKRKTAADTELACTTGQPLKVTILAKPAPKAERPMRIFLPEDEPGTVPEAVSSGLPEEYGVNELLPMPVDPNLLFVSWEVVPSAITGLDGDITLRVYDVTGVLFNGINAHRFVDLPVQERVGSAFFPIDMAGREAVVELGITLTDGTFKPLFRSKRIAFPVLLSVDELGIANKLSSSGLPVGY